MADEDQGWYEDPLGEESINANEEPNEGRPGTDDWSDWNEQEGGSQSTSRKRKNKEELPSGLKWAKKTPPPQALSRWSSNSSWSSAGESPSTWNSWRGMSWKDKEDIDIWLQCSNLGENVPETVIVPCKTPFEGRLADSAYETGILEDHKWFGKQELLERCREQGTPLGLVIDLVNTRKYYSGFNLDDGVEYLKIQIPGREVPPRDVVEEVFNHIDDFTERRPDLYVGLHCTHGLNRTGFVVAAYLMTRRDVAHWKDAVAVFEKARGGKMDKAYLFEALQQLQEGKY